MFGRGVLRGGKAANPGVSPGGPPQGGSKWAIIKKCVSLSKEKLYSFRDRIGTEY